MEFANVGVGHGIHKRLEPLYTDLDGVTDWYLWKGTFFIRALVSYLNEVTGVAEEVLLAPTRFSLAQNFPNPFNPGTTITYELPRASEVRLSVYDILGREVSVLVNGRVDAGSHRARFDGSGLASGVYMYRLEARSLDPASDGKNVFTQSRKLLLLR